MNSSIEILNRRLGEGLGFVCGGARPRFAWLFAPNQVWLVYDRDDRTVIKKSWADMPAPNGGTIGKAWVLGQWRVSKAQDHHGYGDGVRVAVAREAGYTPHPETALSADSVPSDALTANYIRVIGDQMAKADSEDPADEFMAEEKYIADRNDVRDRNLNRERSMHIYDDNVGALGNCDVGVGGGFLSWGGIGESPLVKQMQDTAAATPALS